MKMVPYTKRRHFVLFPAFVENKLGKLMFDEIKLEYKGKVVDPLNPESIRVNKIMRDIVEAHQNSVLSSVHSEKARKKKGKVSNNKYKFKWEVIVVDDPSENALCLPGGKIVINSGLLRLLKEDDEIATIIGHEVAHALARHIAERMSKSPLLKILELILCPCFMRGVVDKKLRLPSSRRMEKEADYIGLLLMATAGYDPRVAPFVLHRLGVISDDEACDESRSTHPSGKNRSKLLSHPKVMGEALSIYIKVLQSKPSPDTSWAQFTNF